MQKPLRYSGLSYELKDNLYMYDQKVQWIYRFVDTILSFVRILRATRFRKTNEFQKNHNQCIIMGNGPSLIESLKENKNNLPNLDLIAVNFMALSPEYIEYKPNIYVLCDPVFWFENVSQEMEEKVVKFYKTIAVETNWNLQLYIPYQAKRTKQIEQLILPNKNIRLNYYNKAKFEGYKKINYWIYNKQYGMLRTQNVIVAALMLAIYSKYENIYLAGVDSDNMKNIWVDEKNRVRLTDTHFYNDEQYNIERVLPIKLHEQCAAFYSMFKSYTEIASYADYRKVKVYNINLRSFIDAFEKKICI